jgi:WD40 repeat protein
MRMPVLVLMPVRHALAAVLLLVITTDSQCQEQQLQPRWTAPLPKRHCLIGFTPDGKTLATVAVFKERRVNRVHLWDVANGKETTSFAIDEVEAPSVPASLFVPYTFEFSPDGKVLAVKNSQKKTIKWYALPDGQLKVTLPLQKPTIDTVSFHLSLQRQLLCLRIERNFVFALFAWDCHNLKLMFALPGLSKYCISPEGRFLFTDTHEPGVRYFDPKREKLFSPNAKSEPTPKSKPARPQPTADPATRVWDARSGKLLARLEGVRLRDTHFLPDSSAVLLDDNLFDMNNWRVLAAINDYRLQRSFSSDGYYMISKSCAPGGKTNVTRDYGFRVWDLRSKRELEKVIVYQPASLYRVSSPEFIPYSKVVIASVFAYSSLADKEEKKTLPPGDYLFFYDATTGRELASMVHDDMDYLCGPDGKSLALISYGKEDGGTRLKLYDMPPGRR